MNNFATCVLILAVCGLANSCEPLYRCINDNTLVIFGVPLLCRENEVCNKFNSGTTCAPCVPRGNKCDRLFKCGEAGTVDLNGAILSCPEFYHCNANGDGECPICVPDKCPDEPSYRCFPEDPTKVSYENTVTHCKMSHVCNDKFVRPCTACIPIPTLPRP